MTPDLKALAERALAAGAPKAAADDDTVIVIPGVCFRSIATGLAYDRATRLPLLSDFSWWGWVQNKLEQQQYDYCIDVQARGVTWLVMPRGTALLDVGGSGAAPDRPTALVAMLEAIQ